MVLFDPSSSSTAFNALTSWGRTFFKGNLKAEIYVAGRKEKNQCRVLKGDGKFRFVPCTLPHNFACENGPVECAYYDDSENNDDWLTPSKLENPTGCFVKNPIVSMNETIAVKRSLPVLGTSIIKINLENTGSVSLPIALAQSFPKLQKISADSNEITEITRANLEGLPDFVWLDMDYNKVTHLLSEVFELVPNLQRIDLGELNLS